MTAHAAAYARRPVASRGDDARSAASDRGSRSSDVHDFKAPTKTKLARLRPNQFDKAQESTKGYQEEHQAQTWMNYRER